MNCEGINKDFLCVKSEGYIKRYVREATSSFYKKRLFSEVLFNTYVFETAE